MKNLLFIRIFWISISDFTPFSPFYQPLINESGHISFQIVLNPYSTLQYLSFEVLHDHICLNLDLTHFRGAPILRGLEKGVRGSKKIGTQNFYASQTIKGHQTKNQKTNAKIQRMMVFVTFLQALVKRCLQRYFTK